jgi:mRNA-degrading endonuclease RelE of RelBE toxin-antitoxin system
MAQYLSGAKPLRHGLKGHYRIRTGDFRIVFRAVADEVWIVRIEHRKDVYED